MAERKWQESSGISGVFTGGMATVQCADSQHRVIAAGCRVIGAVGASTALSGIGTVQRTNSDQAKDKR